MTMRDYIEEQPAVMRRIFENRKENLREFLTYYREISLDHIYIVARGSSYNASCVAAAFMAKVLNTDVTVHFPSKLPAIRAKRPLIIAVSQGGESTNTIAAVKALSAYPLIAATGKAECTVNSLCDRHFDFGCGPETVGPKTKGYTATILSFSLFALEAARISGSIDKPAYDRYCALFAAVPDNMEENIARCDLFVQAHLSEFCSMKKMAWTGKGIDGLLTKECALKIMETLLIPAIHYEFEEYLHGPLCTIDPQMAGFYLLSDDADAKRIEAVARAHQEICPQAYVVTSDDTVEGDRVLHLISGGDDAVKPFAYILPAQFIASEVPVALGTVDKGMRQFRAFDDIVKIKAKR